ncbi:MAG: HlyD family type I secretion periplasmic adaptor subunit [Desulfovermiculus sp.]
MSDNKLQGNNNVQAIEGGKGDPAANLPTSSKKVILVGLIFVALFFGGLGTWAAMAELQGAVIATGNIIVEAYRKQVQHREGGIVQEILVREGDTVEKGQVLIRLDGERERATRDLYRGQMDSLLARQARLRAEKDKEQSITWPQALKERADKTEVKENMETEQEIFETRLAAKQSKIKLNRARISQLQSQIRGQERQLKSVAKTIDSLDEEIQVKSELLEDRYLDRSQVMELQRNLHSYQVRRDELETEIEQAREKIKELELEIEDLEKEYTQESAAELGKVRQSILELREKLRPAEDACRRLEITAPASGVVVNVNVRTEGGVIQGGEPLMEIVPQESALIVSAQVQPDQIDDVQEGQLANVRLQAFSRRYTKKVSGEVTYVSADRVEPKDQRTPPHYLAYIELDQESLQNAIEDTAKLTPGMPAEVYIQTEAKTVLSYIMSPITESMDRAFRE